jgi:hypothetical protein
MLPIERMGSPMSATIHATKTPDRLDCEIDRAKRDIGLLTAAALFNPDAIERLRSAGHRLTLLLREREARRIGA